MNHKKSKIKNYNRGARLQNGMDMDIKQGFADTENSYFNADGTGTVIGTVKSSSFLMGGQDSFTRSPIIGSLWDKDLGQATDTAVLELEQGIFTIFVLGDSGAVWQIRIEAPDGIVINSDDLISVMQLQPSSTIDVFLGSTYVPEGTVPNLPTDAPGIAEMYFNDVMNADCLADASAGSVKNYLISILWGEVTGGNTSAMALEVSNYIGNNMCLLVPDVPGCTDASANNFNPSASINDGSCTYNENPNPSQPLMTTDTITQFDPIDRNIITGEMQTLEDNLFKYEKVTKAAKQALIATKDEYDYALQACSDDQSLDRGSCTDAEDLNQYILGLRSTIGDLEDDTDFITDIADALAAAQLGDLSSINLDNFDEGIRISLEALASNVSTGGDAASALQSQLNQIYDGLADAREDLDYDTSLYPEGSPYALEVKEDGSGQYIDPIDTVNEALDSIDMLITRANALASNYAELSSENTASLDYISLIDNDLIPYLSDLADNLVVDTSEAGLMAQFLISESLADLTTISDAIGTLQTFQTQIQDMGVGTTAEEISAAVQALEDANAELELAAEGIQSDIDDILAQYPPTDSALPNQLSTIETVLSEISDAAQNTADSLADYTVLGTPEDLAQAQQDAILLATILGLDETFTSENVVTLIETLQQENADAAALINSILDEVTDSTSGSIVTDLQTIVSDLNLAQSALNDLQGQFDSQASDLASINTAATALNDLNVQLGSDLQFYETEIAAVAQAVNTLGGTVDGLEDYLEANYGYNPEDYSLDSTIPGVNYDQTL
tara:strand:- start:710 stop:3079 length:2370 start_codon:yes stop_codon:yes gene_type:complete